MLRKIITNILKDIRDLWWSKFGLPHHKLTFFVPRSHVQESISLVIRGSSQVAQKNVSSAHHLLPEACNLTTQVMQFATSQWFSSWLCWSLNSVALLVYTQPTIFWAPPLSFGPDFVFFFLKMPYEPLRHTVDGSPRLYACRLLFIPLLTGNS